MALLSDATVIVEAGATSGTEHQAWEAIRLGRLVLVMESLARAGLPWVEKLLGYGAQVLTNDNLELVVESLPSGERSGSIELAF